MHVLYAKKVQSAQSSNGGAARIREEQMVRITISTSNLREDRDL
jgi:hypothetical protein